MKRKPGAVNMRVQTQWHARDSRNLTSDEKLFLLIVETRGVMKTTWQRAADDMGMKKDTFYRTRKSLIAKDLLLFERKKDAPTHYRVNSAKLRTYIPAIEPDSLTENGDSHTENDHSLTENGHSLTPEPKATAKETEGDREGKQQAKTVAAAGGVNPFGEKSPNQNSESAWLDDHVKQNMDNAAEWWAGADISARSWRKMFEDLRKTYTQDEVTFGTAIFGQDRKDDINDARNPAGYIRSVMPDYIEENLDRVRIWVDSRKAPESEPEQVPTLSLVKDEPEQESEPEPSEESKRRQIAARRAGRKAAVAHVSGN